MRVRVNTWKSFRAGDVIVQPQVELSGSIIVERDSRASFGTALISGDLHHGFLTARGTFVYADSDGEYGVTPNYEEFKPYPAPLLDPEFQPDYRAAVDAYARRLGNVRRGIISMYSDGAARQALLAIVDDGNEAPRPAPLQLSRERLKAAVDESLARFDLGPASYVSRSELVVRAVEMLLQEDLGIEPKA